MNIILGNDSNIYKNSLNVSETIPHLILSTLISIVTSFRQSIKRFVAFLSTEKHVNAYQPRERFNNMWLERTTAK